MMELWCKLSLFLLIAFSDWSTASSYKGIQQTDQIEQTFISPVSEEESCGLTTQRLTTQRLQLQGLYDELLKQNKEHADLILKLQTEANRKTSVNPTPCQGKGQGKGQGEDAGVSSSTIVENYRQQNGLSNSRSVIMESACIGNNVAVLGALLELGFDCETPLDKNGNGCLNLAAHKNNVEAARLLLNRGCDINFRIKQGRWAGLTPIMMAGYHGKLAVAKELLNHNPNLAARTTSGFTALGWARKQKQTALANLLVSVGAP